MDMEPLDGPPADGETSDEAPDAGDGTTAG